jgi:hypothetical protein
MLLKAKSLMLAVGVLVLICIVAVSCKTSVAPQKPAEHYSANTYTPHVSVINFPVEIPVAEIQKQMNAQVNGVIFEDNDLEKDNLMLRVSKREAIQVEAKSNYFNITVPLTIWAKAGWKVSPLGITLSRYEETEFAINIKFATKIGVDQHWNVTTHTSSNGFDWVSKPFLRIGGFDIPMASVIGNIIDQQQEIITRQIDREVKGKVPLRKYVAEAWKTVQNPMLVSSQFDTWLKITPQALMMTPLEGKGNAVRCQIGIKGIVETYVGRKPEVKTLSQLPALQVVNTIPDDFEVGLMGLISHVQAKKMAEGQLVGKVFSFQNGKRKIEVTSMDIWGKGEKLVVMVEMKGSLNGKLYVTGKPVYDPATATIVMQHLDYDLDTRDKLAKAADWMAHGAFVKQMEPYLRFPVGNQIQQAHLLIQQSLQNNRIAPQVMLNGVLSELSPGAIYITPDAIQAVVTAKGKVDLRVDGL